ncbi:PIN domain-containing protein [Chitinophaga sancti]|uniref:PIN domain-containing protein n=1 Tax=Chitinophaga sancti TaxID=1004 RepID=A0A1K1RW80_9BACT|nr:PIN domain-containing protein [Chitinophaga sancti]WQD63989.1 PIN domain-containing protein [Chitinophaga sancti]WQG90387.1 PIN domain-containing protein [Chitinophaga sancti]SFW76353.1 protein of unknown function [Chitinophaga sancti]
MLKTRNIFIDTQAFVSNNFFQSKNLQRLAHWGSLNIVNLFLTEITKSEIQSNIKGDLINARQEINRFKENISKRARILRNLPDFRAYIELPELDLELDFAKLSKELDEFIENGNVEMIPYEYANLKTIITKYFKEEKPFSAGKKKYEFPDAIVLSALDNWCSEKREEMYVISDDADFKGYLSDNLIPISDVKTILDKINKQYDKDLSDWLSGLFEISRDQIIKKLKKTFKDKVKDEIWWDITINSIKVLNTELHDFSIVDKENDGLYIFQFDYDIECEIDATYDDYSTSIYDKEDDKYYGFEESRAKVKIETTQTAELEIEAYYDRDVTPEDTDIMGLSISTTIPDSSNITDELPGFLYVF